MPVEPVTVNSLAASNRATAKSVAAAIRSDGSFHEPPFLEISKVGLPSGVVTSATLTWAPIRSNPSSADLIAFLRVAVVPVTGTTAKSAPSLITKKPVFAASVSRRVAALCLTSVAAVRSAGLRICIAGRGALALIS